MNLSQWFTFTKERFPLLEHLLLILGFFGANAFVTASVSEMIPQGILIRCLLGFIVIFITFFRLRIFDEIKDYDTDCKLNPKRPLARGLITVSDAKKVVFSLIAVELLLSLCIGLPAFVANLCVILYSLLMYNEFFLAKWLRPKLATYALIHTVVSSWLALFVFSTLTTEQIWQAPLSFFLFAFANWMIFNVFEFGRKTFGKSEEKPLVASYSKQFGSWGAASCVFGMAASAGIVALIIGLQLNWPPLLFLLMIALYSPLIVLSTLYGRSGSTGNAVQFRTMCSIFILVYNVIITLGFVL